MRLDDLPKFYVQMLRGCGLQNPHFSLHQQTLSLHYLVAILGFSEWAQQMMNSV
jgi:hypothetical protein